MTTDYLVIGKEALEKLHRAVERAPEVQREQLKAILRQNRETEFGIRRGFSEIHSLRDYQDHVPLSVSEDYQAYTERLIAGERNLLTRAEPVYYAITSGSMGSPKYVPVTEEDMLSHYWGVHAVIYGMVREYYRDTDPAEVFGKIFQVGEFVRTRLSGGQMYGVRSAAIYQWMDREGGFDASDYCVPKEVLFPEDVEDLTYVKVRFALAERKVTAIHSVYLHRVVAVMDYICQNWDLLLRDMERGAVDESVPLRDCWREKLRRWLPPNPARAEELRRLGPDPAGLIRRIWPGMKYIVGIGGDSFPVYTQAVDHYSGGVPIHHYIYGSSESFLSVGAALGRANAYIVIPESGFYEFLPVDHPEIQRPLTMEEVRVGERYEIVLTNHSGLYRCRMRDVVRVVEFCGRAPVVCFQYRMDQVLNVADEKLNMEQLREAFRLYRLRTGQTEAGFCTQEDLKIRPGRYLIYIEGPPHGDASAILDACLKEASLGYLECRTMGDIRPAHVRFLPPGSFHRYESRLVDRGWRLDQYKPVRILDTPEKQQFFAAEADRMERGEDVP